jgi:tRNA threonylcarbamoyladenosine biosynthesis protein TsaE
MTITTIGEEETERFGERLAKVLRPGLVVGLKGRLGAGKTTLVRGIARGLGIDERSVCSPTFITAAQYEGGRLPVVHIDLYRHGDALPERDWLAELLDSDGVALVEWFEHLGDCPHDDVLEIEIGYGRLPNERIFVLRPHGAAARELNAALVREQAA